MKICIKGKYSTNCKTKSPKRHEGIGTFYLGKEIEPYAAYPFP